MTENQKATHSLDITLRKADDALLVEMRMRFRDSALKTTFRKDSKGLSFDCADESTARTLANLVTSMYKKDKFSNIEVKPKAEVA